MNPKILLILIYVLVWLLTLAAFYLFSDSPIRASVEITVGIISGLLMRYFLDKRGS